MLKIATKQDDLDEIIRLGLEHEEQYHHVNPYPLSDEKIRGMVNLFFIEPNTKSIILLYMDNGKAVGMVAARSEESIYHEGKTALEILWHVAPYAPRSAARELREAYEYWAKHVAKCKFITLTALETDRIDTVGKQYARWGYRPVERSFKKEL